MDIKGHDFEIDGGMVIEDRKAHWPDCLTLIIPRQGILKLIRQLVTDLEVHGESQEMPVRLSFMGKLDYDIEED